MAFEKFKRNLGRAFDFRADSRIRNQKDDDETSEGLDYMMSRGKSKKVKEHNARQTEEGLKIRRRLLHATGISGSPK